MVVALPLVVAQVAPATHRAALHAFRIALPLLGIDPRQEALLQLPVVAEVIVDVEVLLASVAQDDMHASRHHALHFREQFGMEAKLQQELCLAGAGQLGVNDLIAVVAEIGGSFDTSQKVRVTDPWCAQKRRLEQDLIAPAQGLFGRAGSRLVRDSICLQIRDGTVLPPENLQVPGLMFKALTLDENHLVGVAGFG